MHSSILREDKEKDPESSRILRPQPIRLLYKLLFLYSVYIYIYMSYEMEKFKRVAWCFRVDPLPQHAYMKVSKPELFKLVEKNKKIKYLVSHILKIKYVENKSKIKVYISKMPLVQ